MRKWWCFVVLEALCIAASHASIKTSGKQAAQLTTSVEAPRDSGKACSCSAVFRRTLDCSNRGKSSFDKKELCFGRTTAINLSKNSFTTFPTSFGSYIIEVNISRNQLTALPRVPPLNSRTTVLDVSYNRISQASTELRSLSSLKTLSVEGNRLQTLGFLPQSCGLQHLSARQNVIRNLDGPLRSCSQLQTLDLSYNQLAMLPRGPLSGMKKLEVLRISNSGLRSLAGGSLENLKELDHLDLSNNGLITLPSGIFASLKDLEKLLLNNNSISNLPADSFVGLKDLELISLTKNKLGSLPHGIFTGLSDLKTLLLDENQLSTLPSGLCQGLQKLKTIDLSNNHLVGVPPTVFLGIQNLKNVNMKNNRLTGLPGSLFSGITSMEIINFSNNQLSSVPPGLFQEMRNLKVLDLSHNYFTMFSGRFLSGVRSLERLDLTHNRLTALPDMDGVWPALSNVSFGYNSIVDVSEHAVRSWLGSGDAKRYVSLEGTPPLGSPESLRWVLGEKKFTTTVAARCQCGGIKRDKAEVRFCLAVSCPGATGSWVEAVRASAPAAFKGRGRRSVDGDDADE